ncbi:MAG: alpha-mannosidase [Coriobacteriaceae bacterium]|nr:glycosyl hydrolase-related protein [Olsenella sp.]RRF89583.1 MAG: alpha-mannosidase [Coriobacteriaceae bacterium]
MRRTIHVVPHSHWDREWYFTTSRSKVYLMKDLADVLDTLEKNPDFKTWMLDGQASLLDDYLAWRPQDESRIRTLVCDGRLVIGPWYTQTDEMLASGESIVRNLYYGMRRCEELGPYMHVGYMPDSFGQSGNMPQIYRQAGFKDTLFWRGVSNDMVDKLNFTWRGDDGSVVFATQMPNGYYIGGNVPEDSDQNDAWWHEQCLDKLASRYATEHVYFPCGFDQAPVRRNLPELVAERAKRDPDNTYKMSSIPEYLADLHEAIDREGVKLEEVQGELLNAKHMRIHRSIWSSRSDLKRLNTKAQFYVTNVLEPTLSLSASLGNEYPKKAVEHIWKLLLENAAHDSMGSCIADFVNADVGLRYKQAMDVATSLVELHSRMIATSIDSGDAPMTITVFNADAHPRSGVVVEHMYLPGEDFKILDEKGSTVAYTILCSRDLTDYVLSQTIKLDPSRKAYVPSKVLDAMVAIDAHEVPAMGYAQYHLVLNESSSHPMENLDRDTVLENEYYRISVNVDGTLRVEDRSNGYVYDHQAVLVENGDDGDSFNYSPPRQDLVVRSDEGKPEVAIEGSDIYQRATIDFSMNVPKDLDERAKGIRSTSLPVRLTVALRRGSRVIDLDVHVDNNVLSHRLCILFDAQMATKFNFADEQFGSIKRENVHAREMALYNASLDKENDDATEDDSMLPANWRQNAETWQEMPVAIEPTQSYVALGDGTRGVAVLPRGVREYEIVGDEKNEICLTLFRTYGFMGKEDLLYRPGRASGERTMETPDAQLLGPLDFDLGLLPFAGSIDEARIAEEARSYDGELRAYEYAEFLNGRLIFSEPEVEGWRSQTGSLFELDGDAIVSAVKTSENYGTDGLIVRLFNGFADKDATANLKFARPVQEAYLCDLREHRSGDVTFEGNVVTLPALGHCKFQTLFVKLASA